MAVLAVTFSGLSVVHAAPVACEVTSDKDIDPTTGLPAPGTFRMALILAMGENCIGKKITFKVSKITMTAPLGIGVIEHLKGHTIAPDPTIPSVEIMVSYDNPDYEVGCSAPSPFYDCFAYLPTSGVTLRNIRVTVDPAAKSAPLRGLCIDRDVDSQDFTSDNRIRLEKNEFNGFTKGGVFVAHTAYGVLITQSVFNDSGPGIVVEPDPAAGPIETPSAPAMGGSPQALFAVLDAKGAVAEYHLRGLALSEASDAGVTPVVELFESDGKAGTHYMQDCAFTKTLIEDKWNIECIFPKSIALPFHYAVTLTLQQGTAPNVMAKTSMFSVGTIPADVAKAPSVTPSDPQPPVTPPKPPISTNTPPAYQEPPKASGNVSDALILKAGSPASAGGCSLIR